MSNKPDIKVLLINDEQTLLEFLSERLVKEGFKVKSTFSGEEALESAINDNYDVAVADLKTAGIDGIETQKRLHEIQPFLQFIVLTGYESNETAFENGHEEAFKYLFKPIDYHLLVDTIKKAYEKKLYLQNIKFSEQIKETYKSDSGAKGIRKAISKVRKIYGIN